jgi:hypothetical protein
MTAAAQQRRTLPSRASEETAYTTFTKIMTNV